MLVLRLMTKCNCFSRKRPTTRTTFSIWRLMRALLLFCSTAGKLWLITLKNLQGIFFCKICTQVIFLFQLYPCAGNFVHWIGTLNFTNLPPPTLPYWGAEPHCSFAPPRARNLWNLGNLTPTPLNSNSEPLCPVDAPYTKSPMTSRDQVLLATERDHYTIDTPSPMISQSIAMWSINKQAIHHLVSDLVYGASRPSRVF